MVAKNIVSGALNIVLYLAPCLGAADVVDVANEVRLQGCGNMSGIERTLRVQAQLGEAARRIADGDDLERATSGSGYRARTSASIHIRTTRGDEGVAQVLAQRFCNIITDASLHEIGVHRRGEETWMVLATPFSPPGPDDASAVGHRVLQLINAARSQARKCGRREFTATTPLQPVAALEQAALAHAQDMAGHSDMGHKGSDGSMPADRATRAGYQWSAVAENVAAGQTTAEEVVNTWLTSPGHCANLMNSRYVDTGIAFALNQDSAKGIYWVQVFGAMN